LCCSGYCLFCVVLRIVCVYMCTVLLPPGGYPIAVYKYIISYKLHIYVIHFFFKLEITYIYELSVDTYCFTRISYILKGVSVLTEPLSGRQHSSLHLIWRMAHVDECIVTYKSWTLHFSWNFNSHDDLVRTTICWRINSICSMFLVPCINP